MKRARKKWTKEEEERLRELAKTHSIREIAEILGRTYKSVQHKLRKLGICAALAAIYYDESKIKLQLTETEKAYLAGFLDGDGSIYFQFGKTSLGHVRPAIKFANTDEKVIRWICEKIPFAHPETRLTRTPRSKRVRKYTATIHGITTCKPILEALKPYLIVKKEACEMALKFCEMRMQKPLGAPFSEEEINLVLQFRRKFGTSSARRLSELEIIQRMLRAGRKAKNKRKN